MLKLTRIGLISLLLVVLLPMAALASALPKKQATTTITILLTPKPANTVIPAEALGAGLDGYEQGDIPNIYTPKNVQAMRSAGFQSVTYRLRTELAVEAWHWNPNGTWSDKKDRCGYWTPDDHSAQPIEQCYGYRLPRRGDTFDQANNDGYSRIDDGEPNTFWKSNPYLDRHFTNEPNSAHPQWVLVDLGKIAPVDALKIAWGSPYATHYRVEYWDGSAGGDSDSIDDTFDPDGAWTTFPQGQIDNGVGGNGTVPLCTKPLPIRFLRITMTEHNQVMVDPSTDIRDTLGYAIQEIGVGTIDSNGKFTDLVQHCASNKQTAIYVSSTDPWHRACDRDRRVEQPGFDRVFGSGLITGQPLLTPVAMIYDTPENSAAEIRYLQSRNYDVREVELGEEPDGQYLSPEDYAAFCAQWIRALHAVDPTLKIGGPSFQTAIYGWVAWPDASGNQSWVNRLVTTLKNDGVWNDFSFFSFEWYPFDDIAGDTRAQLAIEPQLLQNTIERLRAQGLGHKIPIYITEYGYSVFTAESEVDVAGALLNADIVGQFLSLGGQRVYLYGYEPSPLVKEVPDCPQYGNLTLFVSDRKRNIKAVTPAYYGARLIDEHWLPPAAIPEKIYRTSCTLRDRTGDPVITAYAARRPDNRWSVLLIDKDPRQSHTVTIDLRNTITNGITHWKGFADLYQYSGKQYVWHADGPHGMPTRDLPPSHRTISLTNTIILPPWSMTVISGIVFSNRGAN